MKTSRYNSKIRRLEKKINVISSRMDGAQLAFMRATDYFSAKWFKVTVESLIVTKPEITKTINPVQLKELKNNLAKLIGESSIIVKKHLDNNQLWIHKKGLSKHNYEIFKMVSFEHEINQMQNKALQAIQRNVKIVLGYAGELLIPAGYVKLSQPSDAFGEWVELTTHEARYLYKADISWSKDMTYEWKRYSNLMVRYIKSNLNIKMLESEKSMVEAKNLYDQA